MSRDCDNCLEEKVDESKQKFTYRDMHGNKYDSCIRPVCDKCIEAGEYKIENGIKRLYLGSSRAVNEFESQCYWFNM